jgi:phage N-6-adenine-methyltransferase
MFKLGRAGQEKKAPKLSALFSAATDEWPTEDHVVEALRRRGFVFTLDVAATSSSSKAPRHYTKEQDALRQRWRDDAEGGDAWSNPPYSIIGGSSVDNDHHGFVEKSILECADGLRSCVHLLPVRSCRLWFHRLLALQPDSRALATDAVVAPARRCGVTVELLFILGRLRFGAATADAPFPSFVAIVRGQR